jgi:hypothetical protein
MFAAIAGIYDAGPRKSQQLINRDTGQQPAVFEILAEGECHNWRSEYS